MCDVACDVGKSHYESGITRRYCFVIKAPAYAGSLRVSADGIASVSEFAELSNAMRFPLVFWIVIKKSSAALRLAVTKAQAAANAKRITRFLSCSGVPTSSNGYYNDS